MAMTSVNIRMDEQVKKNFDEFCNELGLTMSTAFNLFAKAALRKQKIPFELELDPYFSGENLRMLEQRAKAFDEGNHGVTMTLEELEERTHAA